MRPRYCALSSRRSRPWYTNLHVYIFLSKTKLQCVVWIALNNISGTVGISSVLSWRGSPFYFILFLDSFGSLSNAHRLMRQHSPLPPPFLWRPAGLTPAPNPRQKGGCQGVVFAASAEASCSGQVVGARAFHTHRHRWFSVKVNSLFLLTLLWLFGARLFESNSRFVFFWKLGCHFTREKVVEFWLKIPELFSINIREHVGRGCITPFIAGNFWTNDVPAGQGSSNWKMSKLDVSIVCVSVCLTYR